jgi:hypothetical protein
MQSSGVGCPETTFLTICTVKLTLPRLSNYAMNTSVKIPKSMAEKFAAITALTDAFSKNHLNDEYLQLIRRAVGALARKRPSPLVKGKENVWAAGVVHAVGHVNFLDDPSQSPHCKSKTIYEYFGVAASTGQNKSRGIRDMLTMEPMSPEWSLPSQLIDNPMVWMLKVDGIVIDIRQAPIELQEMAFEQGYIPFIPGKQED